MALPAWDISTPALEVSLASTGDCILRLDREEAAGLTVGQVKTRLRVAMARATASCTALRLLRDTRIWEDNESLDELSLVEPLLQLQVVRQEQMEVTDMHEAIPFLLEKAMKPHDFETTVLELKSIKPACRQSLTTMVSLIVSKACSEPCHAQKLAKLAAAIQSSYAEFPPEAGDKSGLTGTFRRSLLNCLQSEYERWTMDYLELEDDLTEGHNNQEEELERRRTAMLSRLIFLANLCSSKMVAWNVLRSVVEDVIGSHSSAVINRHRQVTSKLYIAECICHAIKSLGGAEQTKKFHIWHNRLRSLWSNLECPPGCLRDFLEGNANRCFFCNPNGVCAAT